MQVLADIHLFRRPYTKCCISDEGVAFSDEKFYKLFGIGATDSPEIEDDDFEIVKKKCVKFVTITFFLRPFVIECMNSDVYRANVVNNLYKLCGCPDNGVVFLKLILEPPDQEIIDFAWNDRMLRVVWTRIEIENAFSWLSTLGGAYSALGDYFDHCAEEAGRISVRQYKLSKMLGDESLAARSQLYAALSLSQKGHLKISRRIVRNVAEFGRATRDRRLIRMCQGVWAKLIYLRSLRRSQCDVGNGDNKITSA